MVRWPVSSSVLKAVAYDPARLVLDVEFHNERVYRYRDVGHRVYDAFMKAASKGRFFNEQIRDTYDFERIE